MNLKYTRRQMVKNLNFNDLRELIEVSSDPNSKRYWEVLSPFISMYEQIVDEKKLDKGEYFSLLAQYCSLVAKQIDSPWPFTSYHAALREPIDYHILGREIFRPLVNIHKSTLSGIENIKEIESSLVRGENVILYANHQIEADPQALSLLLEDIAPQLAEQFIFVAGERVLTDPLAVPFSLGCNLFCIYSKKYFTSHPDRAAEMKKHNAKTISEISSHLNLGSKCIYIAPSGGRDRKGSSGEIEVAPFDPQSVELMYLIGKKSKKLTHFYPLSLSTHDILPPPEGLQINLGEMRLTKEAPIHAHFGKKIDMENFPLSDTTSKKKRKDERTQYIYKAVCDMYAEFPVL